MQAIATLGANNANPFSIGISTRNAFVTLLERHRAEIEGFPTRTFHYGRSDRHHMDVYYPVRETLMKNSIPVLFFVYGGGLVAGDRKYPPPYDLLYGNLGTFFGKRGIMTIIADYRIMPGLTYPQPVEDIHDALAWFLSNTETVLASNPAGLPVDADLTRNIFVMGHSAGGNIVSSLYLSPEILPLSDPIRPATRGLILQGGAVLFVPGTEVELAPMLTAYYGSEEEMVRQMPIALLERAADELVAGLPPVYVQLSEIELGLIGEGNERFVEVLQGRLAPSKTVKFETTKGHNHFSLQPALLSGEGEQWAEDVAAWVKSHMVISE